MTLSVTQFNGDGHDDDGGCILGVSISHGIVDGFSFHKIVRLLSKIYNGDEDAGLIEYDGNRYYEELTREYRKRSLHMYDMASDSVQTINYSAYYKYFYAEALFVFGKYSRSIICKKQQAKSDTRIIYK